MRYCCLFFVLGWPLIAQVRTAASPQSDENRCALQGRITDALTGEPVAKATIQLRMRAPYANAPVYSGTSEADGTYKFANVDPGPYNLNVSSSGYADSSYGASLAIPTGAVLNLRPGQKLTKIDVVLMPLGTVSGRVTDENGNPAEKASVAVLGSVWYRGEIRYTLQNGARTDELGQFRISNIRPGKYYLMVLRLGPFPSTAVSRAPGKHDIRPVRTYYPNALTLDSATPLTIKSGQQLTTMDIQLRNSATYHLRGQVSGAAPEHLAVALVLRDGQSAVLLPDLVTVKEDHTFDIPGVPPGSYTLCAFPTGPLNALGRQDVKINNADLNNLQLVLSPASVQAHITVENNPPAGVAPIDLKSIGILLQATEPMGRRGYIRPSVREDGTLAFENLAPCKYAVLIGGLGKVYVKSIQFANREILAQELDLTHGGGELNVVLRYGPAELRGTIPELHNNPKAARDVTLALISDTAPEDPFGIRTLAVERGWSFVMGNIPPGHYHAYAIEKLDSTQLQNPKVLKALQSYSTEINLFENDRKQIELPLITADQMQQIYAQPGIETP